MNEPFPCYLVQKRDDGRIEGQITSATFDQLPPGDVLVRVAYSSLNYKDALAASGHPGVAKQLPHVPGIDAAGTVVDSRSPQFKAGDRVVITGYDLGEGKWGGYAGYVRMPAEHIVPLPPGLTLRESMVYGTAGFTAAQSLMAIQEQQIEPGRGPVLVTGATGGVGTLAVALLAKAGYEVVASSGKPHAAEHLLRLGAAKVVSRESVVDTSKRPLLSAHWAAAVDTVGGETLGTIVRSMLPYGVVAATGLVGGAEIPLTVYPLLLRGVVLAGIASASCPMPRRSEIWRRLANEWKIAGLEELAQTIDLTQLPAFVAQILAGQITGRVVVAPTANGEESYRGAD